MSGTIAWSTAIAYSLAQLLGAMLGSTLVFLQFRPHYLAAESQADILGTLRQVLLFEIPAQTY